MAVKNSLTHTKSETAKMPFQSLIKSDAVQENIRRTLGDATRSQRFTASLISAVNANSSLSECSGVSIVSAALLGESLNLSPSPQLGHYYMVPYNDNKSEDQVKQAQFQLGYKGYLQLAIRSGQYKRLNVISVKEGELVKFDPFNEEIEVKAINDPDEREKAKTVGYYAMFELINGYKKSMYWSKEKMIVYADKYSPAFSKGPYNNGDKSRVSYADYEAGKVKYKDMWKYSSFWYKDFDAMAYKTMLRQLISKWGIMSIEMQNAYTNDMGYRDTLDENDSPKYADNNDAIDAETDVKSVAVNSETGEVSAAAVEPKKNEAPQNENKQPVMESLI